MNENRKAADAFGTCSTAPCKADDANMDYCTVNAWPISYGHPFGDAMVNLDAQTDMYDTYQATCGSQTDIGAYFNSSPEIPPLQPGTYGAWQCTKRLASNSSICDQGSLVINTSMANTAGQIRKTLCHEVGHAAGLMHGTSAVVSGCMISGQGTWSTYSAHHVAHINSAY